MDNFVDELIEIEDGGNLLRGFLQSEQIFDLMELQVPRSEVIGVRRACASSHGSSQSSPLCRREERRVTKTDARLLT